MLDNPVAAPTRSGEETTALAGIRVLDFGQYVAGPLAALMLADQGADVVRIDPPGGARWSSPANAVLQRGKKSLCLDLKDPDGARTAQRLVATADVLIENFRPGVMDRLGLGYDECRAINPRLIYCALPGFARDDARADLAGWEGIVSAAAGLYTPYAAARADIPGAGTQPAVTAIPIASNFAAFAGANAILAALIARERIGSGQFVEVPLFAAAFEAINAEAQRGPPPTHNPFHPAADNRFRCADGRWVQLLMIAPRHLAWFVERFLPLEWSQGLGDVALLRRDPKAGLRLRQAIADLLATRPADEWERPVNEAGVPLAVCQTIDEFLASDAQARAAQAVIALDDPELGPTLQLGYPVRLSRTPPKARGPRRRSDADRAELMSNLPQAPAEAKPPTPPPPPSDALGPPLQGIRVVDMSQVLAAPTAVRILAELGAEVVKINHPDNWLIGQLQFNSGKRSALLDIGRPEGRAALADLTKGAHIFVHNLRAKTAVKLGVDEAAIRALSPEIVYATVSPYGAIGSKAEYRGWEPVGQAVTGLQTRLGGAGAPRLARHPLCDFGAGNLFAFAMLLGLWRQLRAGEGQHVETSLMHAGAYHQSPYMIQYSGQRRNEIGGLSATGWAPLDRIYRAADGWFYLRADDRESLARVEGLSPPDSASALEAYLEQVAQSCSADIWVERLRRAGIAAHAMVTIDQLMESDYARARRLSIVRTHSGVGEARTIGPVMRFSVTPARIPSPAPSPGWDTRAILTELYGAEAAEAMIDAGVAAERLSADAMIVW
jgi:crotonobetainyl-CoA:carnitine CoA-transferase CaiB-like acyl-CoA transferase